MLEVVRLFELVATEVAEEELLVALGGLARDKVAATIFKDGDTTVGAFLPFLIFH